jgi:hypothetical protein
MYLSPALLVPMFFLFLGSASASTSTSWASVTSVHDLTGGTTVQTGQPLVAGHSYNVTFSIAVPFNQTSSHFQVSLNPELQQQGAQYWYVLTPGYAGYDSSNFTAGDKTVSFTQIQGQLMLSAEFQIPVNLTVKSLDGVTLHFPQNDFQLITVSVSGGSQAGNVSLNVQDQTIETYLSSYQQDSGLISSGKIASSYSSFVNNVLNQSQSLSSQGLVSQATSLLGVLTSSTFPAPPNSSSSTFLAVGLLVVIVIAVAFAVLAFRKRGQSSVASSVLTDVQKELAILEVTATKYDKNLAARLKALRERLNDVI